jgi:hypothetical protein
MKRLPKFLIVTSILIIASVLLTSVARSSQGEFSFFGSSTGTPQPGASGAAESFFLPFVRFTQTFSISGRVVDQNNNPIPNVQVVDNSGKATTTDGNGNYSLTGLTAGDHALAPEKAGHVFTPSLKEVDLSGAMSNVNFTALQQCNELIVNGGFENNNGWEFPATEWTAGYTTSAAHSGVRSARTGIVNPVDNRYSYSSTRQLFTVPANATSVTARVWLYPVSGSAATTTTLVPRPSGPDFESAALATDVQYVVVLDQFNNLIGTLLWMLSDQAQWGLYEFDLTKYAGTSIKIHIGTANDGVGGVSYMFVDDVSIESCPEAGVQPTPTPIPTGVPPTCTNQMVNPGFENGNGWVIPTTVFSASYSTVQAHSGTRSMRTGITGTTPDIFSYSDAYQVVNVPSNAAAATLNMWIFPSSLEASNVSLPAAPVPGTLFGEAALSTDVQYVLVLNPVSQTITEVLMWQLSNSQTWVNRSFDLTKYKGSTIRIQFGTFNDGDGMKSSMYVDDATLLSCTSLPPTATPSASPPPTQTPVPVTPPAPTPTPGGCTELMLNNSFENNNGWVIPITEFSAGYSTTRAHSGLRSMRTGIEFIEHNRYSYSDFRQAVTIPISASSVTLNTWTWAKSQEVAANTVQKYPTRDPLLGLSSSGDVQYILILDAYGNWIDTLLWQLSDLRQWENDSFDLSNYKGYTIKIQFGTYNNGLGGVSSMFVDDTTLQVCP